MQHDKKINHATCEQSIYLLILIPHYQPYYQHSYKISSDSVHVGMENKLFAFNKPRDAHPIEFDNINKVCPMKYAQCSVFPFALLGLYQQFIVDSWDTFALICYTGMLHWHWENHMHDDVIRWKHFPRNWPFVRGIHRPGPVTRSFDVFFDLRLNKRLNKQPWGWWFETPSWLLWRHCNGLSLCLWSHLEDRVKIIP